MDRDKAVATVERRHGRKVYVSPVEVALTWVFVPGLVLTVLLGAGLIRGGEMVVVAVIVILGAAGALTTHLANNQMSHEIVQLMTDRPPKP